MSPRAALRADLPPTGLIRWTPKQKAAVVAAVLGRAISTEAACERYALSVEEFAFWRSSFERGGPEALRATRIQEHRREARTARRRGPLAGIRHPVAAGRAAAKALPGGR